jgi:2,3-bisphosphoglycerate-dependent phosphoglycerate mutase
MSTLVLLRHGESEWNRQNRFTGWADVDLTEVGEAQARDGGRRMAEAGFAPDVVHTSVQKRAIRTANLALEELDRLWIPTRRHWRLNERHYGTLQGLDKSETAAKFGEDQVKIWRRSYDVPPEPLDWDDPRHPRFDERYRVLPPHVLPASECLADVVARMLPYWFDHICIDLLEGRRVLVAAHGNSLRALAMHLEELTRDEVLELNIPTGMPRVYELDEQLELCAPVRYLASDQEVAAAEAAVKAQGRLKTEP